MPKRMFTRAEDEMIVAQSLGAFSIYTLERTLCTTRETIFRRAYELNVTPLIKSRRRGPRRRATPPAPLSSPIPVYTDTGDNPHSVGSDKLLAKLIEVHGDRLFKNGEDK